MDKMFSNCKNLNNLNLSSFDTKNVVEAESLFYGCPEKIINSNLSVFKNFDKEYLTKPFNDINEFLKKLKNI